MSQNTNIAPTTRHRGRPPKGDNKRVINVSTRLSLNELSLLDGVRGSAARGEFMRMSLLNKTPVKIPEINKLAWNKLARAAGNLNQAMKIYNAKPDSPLDLLNTTLHDFRAALIGANFDNQDNDEDNDEDD